MVEKKIIRIVLISVFAPAVCVIAAKKDPAPIQQD